MYRREKEHKKLQTRIRQEQKMKQAGQRQAGPILSILRFPPASENDHRDKNFYQFSGFDVSSLDLCSPSRPLIPDCGSTLSQLRAKCRKYQNIQGQLRQSSISLQNQNSIFYQQKRVKISSHVPSCQTVLMFIHLKRTNLQYYSPLVKYPSCIYKDKDTCLVYNIVFCFRS